MRAPPARAWLAVAAAATAIMAMTALVLLGRGDGDLRGVVASGTTTTAPPPATATTTGSTATSAAPTTGTTSSPTTAPTTSPGTAPTTQPPVAGPSVPVRRGNPDRREVALTFDAGSDAGAAAQILDLLAADGIRATFGVTGRWAEAQPDLVRRMVDGGHLVVNHSYDHPSFTGRSTGEAPLSAAERLDQLARADAAIVAAGGRSAVPWFRPPYGDEDAGVRADVARAGYRYELLWTVDSLGWRGLAPDDVVRRCLDGAVPGAIYLFHVGAASTDVQALPRIIDGLRDAGYGFVTAAEAVAG